MSSTRERFSRGLKALFVSKFVVTIAIGIQVTIVGLQVFELTGSKLQLGLIGLTEFVPTALLSPFTGSFADRFDRRKVLAAGLAGELAAAVLLFIHAATDPSTVFPIYIYVFLFGISCVRFTPCGRCLSI
ncbi:MAG: MFS transporter [Acidimicrobiales bacterium]